MWPLGPLAMVPNHGQAYISLKARIRTVRLFEVCIRLLHVLSIMHTVCIMYSVYIYIYYYTYIHLSLSIYLYIYSKNTCIYIHIYIYKGSYDMELCSTLATVPRHIQARPRPLQGPEARNVQQVSHVFLVAWYELWSFLGVHIKGDIDVDVDIDTDS